LFFAADTLHLQVLVQVHTVHTDSLSLYNIQYCPCESYCPRTTFCPRTTYCPRTTNCPVLPKVLVQPTVRIVLFQPEQNLQIVVRIVLSLPCELKVAIVQPKYPCHCPCHCPCDCHRPFRDVSIYHCPGVGLSLQHRRGSRVRDEETGLAIAFDVCPGLAAGRGGELMSLTEQSVNTTTRLGAATRRSPNSSFTGNSKFH
jgi:hypothetical protein